MVVVAEVYPLNQAPRRDSCRQGVDIPGPPGLTIQA